MVCAEVQERDQDAAGGCFGLQFPSITAAAALREAYSAADSLVLHVL
jgi:hypothetical protein